MIAMIKVTTKAAEGSARGLGDLLEGMWGFFRDHANSISPE